MRADVGAAHRSVWGRSSYGICLCLSAWKKSFSAEAQPWRSPLLLLLLLLILLLLPLLLLRHFLWPPGKEKTTPVRVERGVSAPSSRSNSSFHFTLGHDCNSSLPLRAAEQEMNSTHSFPKFPSPPPPPPSTGREGLVGNVVLRLPNVLNSGFLQGPSVTPSGQRLFSSSWSLRVLNLLILLQRFSCGWVFVVWQSADAAHVAVYREIAWGGVGLDDARYYTEVEEAMTLVLAGWTRQTSGSGGLDFSAQKGRFLEEYILSAVCVCVFNEHHKSFQLNFPFCSAVCIIRYLWHPLIEENLPSVYHNKQHRQTGSSTGSPCTLLQLHKSFVSLFHH